MSAPVRVALIAAILLAGCDHTAPFASGAPAERGPRGTGNPLRVTYNVGTDLRPSWLPDGSGFYYTAERTDRADRDRCLVLMRSAGGSMAEQICDRSPTSDDSIAVYESAAVAADGRLAYVLTATPVSPPTIAPRTVELRLGTRAAPGGAILRSLPYTAPSGLVHQGLESLQWLDASRLLFVAQAIHYESPCRGCELDTVRAGLEIVTMDVSAGVPVTVPGSERANAVAASGNDTIYYSRDSLGVIERHILSTGAVSVLHTFGVFARDLTAGGGRVAVVTDPGLLWLIQPGGGLVPLSAPNGALFRRPALSPDGRHMIVEGYATAASRSADLWLFDLP